jgi:hypothetical protein
VAARLATDGIAARLERGRWGELSVWVDGRRVARKRLLSSPSDADFVAAVRRAVAPPLSPPPRPEKPWKSCLDRTGPSGRRNYEIFQAEIEFLTWIDQIVENCGFEPQGPPLVGLSQVYVRFAKGRIRLVTGWDNWTGCFVYAQTRSGDPWVEEIGRRVDALIEGWRFPESRPAP